MRKYITAKFPESEIVRETGRTKAMLRVRRFMARAGNQQSRIREAGGDFGPWKKNIEIQRIVRKRTSNRGTKLIVQRQADTQQLSIRAIEPEPPIADLGCHPEVERIHASVWNQFRGNVRSGGIYVCRFIDGTSTVSKHGYRGSTPPPPWRGAAEDIFIKSGGMTELERVADYIVAETQAGRLSAATVIVNRRIWTRDGGWRAYTGVTHYHIHVDVDGGQPCM